VKRSVWASIGAGVIVVVGLGVFAACSGDEPAPTVRSTSEATAEPGADEWTRGELAAALFESADTGALGTAAGAVPNSAGPNPATIEVTAVHASATSTLVWFTLLNVDDSDPTLHPEGFNADEPGALDIRGITLVDAVLGQRLRPFVGHPVADDTLGSPLCACSNAPLQMSTKGQLLSAVFPALDPGAATVTLELAGFPAIEDLPVTRD
jgi:hypothetical protein